MNRRNTHDKEFNTQIVSHSNILFFTLLVVVILDRWSVLSAFCFKYVDSDQTVIWYSVTEILKGKFHEPCFYGQSYNPMFEGLLASPLVGACVPLHIALPLITSLIGIFPLPAFSIYLSAKK